MASDLDAPLSPNVKALDLAATEILIAAGWHRLEFDSWRKGHHCNTAAALEHEDWSSLANLWRSIVDTDTTYVSLTFRLSETVTPELFAQRIAMACFSGGALREDEAVIMPDGSGRELIDNGPIDLSALEAISRRKP
jgi:hypothetical protein